jgi:heme/copper-type cytochrome/quinol oxidase subunit 3
MSTVPDTQVIRSATTGEPVKVVERRNRLGIWLCIVSDAAGVVALLVAYAYLWSLNVNDGWAPPNNAWADPLPFWLITLGALIVAVLLWWAVRGARAGNQGRLILGSGLALLVALVTFIGQIVQLSTFPFGPSDSAYASATFWLCIGAAFHLSLMVTLVLAVFTRSRKRLINQGNPYHAHLVAMFGTWVVIAIFLGSLFATTMTTSPNSQSPAFGEFQSAASSSAAPSGAAASPSASAAG